jgi:hypothetical protein
MAILYIYNSKGSSFKKISDGGKMSIDSNFARRITKSISQKPLKRKRKM